MKHSNEDQHNDDGNDGVRAENAFMKLKLEMEHQMQMSEFSEMDPILEHQFLSHVLEFEKHYHHAKQITLYEFLEKPHCKKAETLSQNDISTELQNLRAIMEAKGVVLDCIEKYSDDIIYKFITEELFLVETDDFIIPGMIRGYIYEEFHPTE